jgi:cytochrome P450
VPETSDSPSSLTPATAVVGDQRHELYAELNAQGPVHPFMFPAGVPAWMVTGYTETRALLSDPRVVKGGWQAAVFADKMPEDVARGMYMTMLNSSPPAHTRLRKLVTSVFTRRRVEQLVPRIQQVTDEMLTAAEGPGPIDLIDALAYPLPLTVICDLIGVPEEDRTKFRTWTKRHLAPDVYAFDDFMEATSSLLYYGRELVQKKRSEPQDDLLSALITARDEGEGLTEDELTSMMFLLLLAGHETTMNLIGNSVRALLTHPDQYDLLRESPELLDSAIEEVLRYDCPLQNTLQYRTTEPIEVGGVTLEKGARVYFALAAANRDEREFSSSSALDIARDAPAHVAFGHGIHRCLGEQLARTEARIVLHTLFDRFPRLRLAVPAEDLTRLPGVIMNGLSALPVHLS